MRFHGDKYVHIHSIFLSLETHPKSMTVHIIISQISQISIETWYHAYTKAF